jgi:hypothetical protein
MSVDGLTRKEPHEIPPEIRAAGWEVEVKWSDDGQRVGFDLYSPLPKRGPSREYDWVGSFTFVRFERGGQIEGLTLVAQDPERGKILKAIFSAGATAKTERPAEKPCYAKRKKV